MVLVTVLGVDYIERRDYSRGVYGGDYDYTYVFELEVKGYKPETARDVIGFITKWAKTLKFSYTRYARYSPMYKWGYVISELAKNKIYVGAVPENTYEFESGKQINCNEANCYWMFVEEGYPVRHIYFVWRDRSVDELYSYKIRGYGIDNYEMIDMSVTFLETAYNNLDDITYMLHPEYKSQEYRSMIKDRKIHTTLTTTFPALEEIIETGFDRILKLAKKKRQKKRKKQTEKH
ncbi:MAG: hypothetical protein QXJ64_10000 [Thermosphaera sp.]